LKKQAPYCDAKINRYLIGIRIRMENNLKGPGYGISLISGLIFPKIFKEVLVC